jgi:signal transduction histidine kinase
VVSLTASIHRAVTAQPSTAGFGAARSFPPGLVDAAVALAALAGSLALLAHGGGLGLDHARSGGLDPIRIALVAAATVPLLAWRRSPLRVFAVSASASVLLAMIGNVIWPPLGPAAALYLLASSRHEAAPWTPRSAGLVAVLLIAYLGAGVAVIGFAGSELVHAGLACAAAWFAGERTRLRREQIADLSRRAMRAEQDAARERQLAVAEERARIARDLHDSAGHALNVITVRAGAARLRHVQDPDRSLSALVAIEDIARETVADLDQFVGSLRADDAAGETVETPPGLASLDTLVAQHRAAGLRLTVDRGGAARAIGAAANQAAYRVLQEALTNAARHGTGAADIELVYGDTSLDIAVTNPVSSERTSAGSRGHGLVGMRERATLLGGQLTAEQSGGAFRVRAHIPYAGHGA